MTLINSRPQTRAELAAAIDRFYLGAPMQPAFIDQAWADFQKGRGDLSPAVAYLLRLPARPVSQPAKTNGKI